MSHDALIDALRGSIETTISGAIVYRNAEGLRHRIGGPAIIYPNGTKLWMQNGIYHRTDGPAIERREGYVCYWYINGCAKTADEFNECIASGVYSEP